MAEAPDARCIEEMHGPSFVTDLYLNGGIYRLTSGLLLRQEPLHAAWIGVSVLVFLSALVGWPVNHWIARRRDRTATTTRPAVLARWLAGTAAALNLVFLIALLAVILHLGRVNPTLLLFGLPPVAGLLFILPPLAAVLAILTVGFAWLAWRKRYWSLAGRIHYSLVVLAALGFVGFLHYWGLVWQ